MRLSAAWVFFADNQNLSAFSGCCSVCRPRPLTRRGQWEGPCCRFISLVPQPTGLNSSNEVTNVCPRRGRRSSLLPCVVFRVTLTHKHSRAAFPRAPPRTDRFLVLPCSCSRRIVSSFFSPPGVCCHLAKHHVTVSYVPWGHLNEEAKEEEEEKKQGQRSGVPFIAQTSPSSLTSVNVYILFFFFFFFFLEKNKTKTTMCM